MCEVLFGLITRFRSDIRFLRSNLEIEGRLLNVMITILLLISRSEIENSFVTIICTIISIFDNKIPKL